MSSACSTTVIKGGTVIAFDGSEHRKIEKGVVVICGDRILHVGRTWDGPSDLTIDAEGKLVIPGQISTHAHVGAHETQRALIDGGQRQFLRSGFLHFLPSRRSGELGVASQQDLRASLRYGFSTLLRHGITSVLAFAPGGPDDGETMVEAAGEAGIRLFWAPIVVGGRYWLENDGRVTRELDETHGLQSLQKAVSFIERYSGANDGRLSGIIAIDEFYVSTPHLRQRAKEVARSLGIPFTMHFLEQHREFFETMAATGKTPVQELAAEGVLDDRTVLAHCVYLGSHSLVNYPVVDDIAILGDHGASVSHSPVAFSRRGVMLESFERYRRAGVTVALGTDTFPLDMFAEMRTASTACKAVERNFEAAPAQDVFAASNLEGAKALGRSDIGRISVGAKADLVIVDTKNLTFGINPDPIRALVHLATPQMIETVVVDGRIVVSNKKLVAFDEEELLSSVRSSSERMWQHYSRYHPSGLSLTEQFPTSILEWTE
ncbi:amidohydrolase family protein [Microvirga sp. BT689]|uniref:amidohydrolase family protein n=1 Tax=Microvirga arvi TaxID=2778731 RepID=UPI001950F7B7|nr:amidohydrolase family protein [Microvirga arvi]MBM6583530.1 amidohydrolase family protein [Microvirga arvi]